MTNATPLNGMDDSINANAVSVYGNGDAMDDFPVLKAFQQYIDSEQAKARKRMVTLGIFFCILTFAIVAVFVVLLIGMTSRNQQLNDRLVEFAMNERRANANASAPVVVQPAQDSSAMLQLNSRIEELQKQFQEKEAETKRLEAEKQARIAAEEKVRKELAEVKKHAKDSNKDQLEIERLKTLLSQEKEKVAQEKAKQKELELEAYRRQHYPELYEPKKPAEKAPPKVAVVEDIEDDEEEIKPTVKQPAKKPAMKTAAKPKDKYDKLIATIDSLNDEAAVSYFDEDEDEEKSDTKATVDDTADETQSVPFSIPVEIKGSKKSSTWSIPEE